MERVVNCPKYGESVGLDSPPFNGQLGQEIFERVSKKAWLEWRDDYQIKVLNEFRLNLAAKEDYKKLQDHMRKFLGLDSNC